MTGRSSFPETRATLVAALASTVADDQARALDLIGRAYRDPIILLLRHRWNIDRADAEDLAHEFFARAVEKEWFNRYDALRGRFRTFIRTCVDDFARAHHRDAQRLKRGGGTTTVLLNPESAELASNDDMEHLFDREWARGVLTIAAQELQRECREAGKDAAWEVYQRYDLTDDTDAARPTYAQIAAELGESTTQITNFLAWARRRMREHVLATIRSLTADEAEFRAEVQVLLGDVLP